MFYLFKYTFEYIYFNIYVVLYIFLFVNHCIYVYAEIALRGTWIALILNSRKLNARTNALLY